MFAVIWVLTDEYKTMLCFLAVLSIIICKYCDLMTLHFVYVLCTKFYADAHKAPLAIPFAKLDEYGSNLPPTSLVGIKRKGEGHFKMIISDRMRDVYCVFTEGLPVKNRKAIPDECKRTCLKP